MSSLVTARALILLQLVSRLVTFTLNQALIRLAPPAVFGTAAIQFDLICSTILFLSREGVRNAVLRSKSDARLAAAPFWVGQLVSVGVLGVYLVRLPVATSSQPDFYPALACYVLAALLELAVEPHYVRALRSDPPRLRVRVQAEGGMAIVRAAVTAACVAQRPLLGFAIGHFSGAAWLAARYIYEFGTEGLLWVPWSGIDASLALANARQSLIKHLLTEADRIAVSVIYPLADQGGYAIAINYGSLIARILFQPIEETLFLHFSSDPSVDTLRLALRLSLHLLVLLPSFLPPLLPVILPILLPTRYRSTSAPAILQTYLALYIPLLSLNGILEAYHTATATPAQVARQIRWMLASSVAFCAALYLQGRGGGRSEAGLVWASSAAVVVRIAYAYRHAAGRGLRGVLPKWPVVLLSMASGIVLRVVERESWIKLLGIGAPLGATSLGVASWLEYRDWKGKLKTA